MKKQNQSNGKGDKSRITDKKIFDMNWEKIFKPQVSGSKTKNNTRKVK